MSEWQSIVATGKLQNSYGSFVRSKWKPVEAIPHDVDPNDTLQGIALKYGTTTEELRRINKLYFSDSIVLRRVLLVPKPKDSSPEKVKKAEGAEVKVEEKKETKKETEEEKRVEKCEKNEVKKMENGEKEEEKDSNDINSFLQKMDVKINAHKQAASSILSTESDYNKITRSTASSMHFVDDHRAVARTPEPLFRKKNNLTYHDDLFKL